MIHAYHVVLSAYGFWLPNDPRGSWSEFVGKWELVRLGYTTRGQEFRKLSQLSPRELRQRESARAHLKYPAVQFSDRQICGIGDGFDSASADFGYQIYACSILPEHSHLVIARHRYKMEHVCNKLKAATSRALLDRSLHPLIDHARPNCRPPRMWSEGQWIRYLDSSQEIEDAMSYVIENPIKEGYPRQHWSFVRPFPGIELGCVRYM